MPLQRLLEDDYKRNAPQHYMITGTSGELNQPAGDFTMNFSRPLDLSHGNYNIELVDLTVWQSLYNISDEYNNRGFRWCVPRNAPSDNTPVVFTGFITAGVYNAPTLLEAIYDIMASANYAGSSVVITGDVREVLETNISLEINSAQLTFDIALGGLGFGFDPSRGGESNLYRNLGADKNIFYVKQGASLVNNPTGYTNRFINAQPFENQADVNNGITSWQVRCSLVGSSFQNGLPSDVMFNFVPEVAPGGAFSTQPSFPLKHQVNAKSVSSVRFMITDQRGRVLNLQQGTDFQNNATTVSVLISRIL